MRTLALLILGTAASWSVPGQETSAPGGLGLFEAVRLALERDPNVAIEEARLEAARGSLAVAQSTFDPLVTGSLTAAERRIPESASQTSETRSLTSTLGVSQTFRSGLAFEPEVTLAQSDDLTANAPALNTGTLTLRFRQPLLRGRGRAVTTAVERAAERELAAAGLELRHEIARRLVSVVTAYWTAAAVARDLAVLEEGEARARALLETTRALIEADQVPAAELVQLEANLASRESATLGGERALFTAQRDLGREIGLTAAEIDQLPLPSDPFPAPAATPLPLAERLIELARAQRGDLAAARERREVSALLRRAAANALLPLLDLTLAPSYSGLAEGGGFGNYVGPLSRDVPGASAALTLSLSWPTANRRAEGELIRADAALRQSELAVERLEKGLDADVPAALVEVEKNALRLAKARDAVRLFERAVVNEEKKLKAGTSTLLDLISQRDRLTAAEQGAVQGELALALALLRLRFETGTLFAERGEAAELRRQRLTTVPDPSREVAP